MNVPLKDRKAINRPLLGSSYTIIQWKLDIKNTVITEGPFKPFQKLNHVNIGPNSFIMFKIIITKKFHMYDKIYEKIKLNQKLTSRLTEK